MPTRTTSGSGTTTHSRDAVALSAIEFNAKGSGTEQLADYCTLGRAFFSETGLEVVTSMTQVSRAIQRTMQGGRFDRMQSGHTAKRAVAHGMRAGEHLISAAEEMARQWKTYSDMFAEYIEPTAQQWQFDPTGRR